MKAGRADSVVPPAEPSLPAAAEALAERGILGIAWLDEELVVRHRHGKLVEFIPFGEKATDSVIALLGFDGPILALRRSPGQSVVLPDISIDFKDATRPRITLQVIWVPPARHFMLIVSPAIARTDMEVELARQVRLRSIAEAEVVEKSAAMLRANQELERANKDLEEFAYVISHDLRAPMRGLRYAATDLERALKAGERESAAARIGEMSRQITRMNGMLSGLLEYSRVGRKADIVSATDTRALVDEIVTSLATGTTLRIEVAGRWPKLDTLAAPLDLVLRNLLDNAIKHHDRTEGLVRVSAQLDREAFIVEVADDGPGIPPEWQSAVFLPFRKHEDEEADPESSGIGLALVHKTLERVGGSIELQSDPPHRRGVTFVVRWPRRIKP